MMPIKVFYCMTYLARGPSGWRQDDFCANKLVSALKQKRIRGYANIAVDGGVFRLTDENRHEAPRVFAALALPALHELAPRGCVLVPFPNSDTSLECTQPPTTLALANALKTRAGNAYSVEDILRFVEEVPSASSGAGTRDPLEIWTSLRRTRGLRPRTPVVLVDDVMTTGGHLQAGAAELREAGLEVRGAIVAARTVHETDRPVFRLESEDVADADFLAGE